MVAFVLVNLSSNCSLLSPISSPLPKDLVLIQSQSAQIPNGKGVGWGVAMDQCSESLHDLDTL